MAPTSRPNGIQPEPCERPSDDVGPSVEPPPRKRRHARPKIEERTEAPRDVPDVGIGPDERGEIDRRFEP